MSDEHAIDQYPDLSAEQAATLEKAKNRLPATDGSILLWTALVASAGLLVSGGWLLRSRTARAGWAGD